MDGIEEYHAKWNKPSSKNQRSNVFPDKWRMIYNGGGDGEWENNGGTLEYAEENEREGVWKMVEWNRHHYPIYIHVWLHEWYESILCTTIEMRSCTPFVYEESKCSLLK